MYLTLEAPGSGEVWWGGGAHQRGILLEMGVGEVWDGEWQTKRGMMPGL